MSRFIDPTTDFGFKKTFGEEADRRSFVTDRMIWIGKSCETIFPSCARETTLDINLLAAARNYAIFF